MATPKDVIDGNSNEPKVAPVDMKLEVIVIRSRMWTARSSSTGGSAGGRMLQSEVDSDRMGVWARA